MYNRRILLALAILNAVMILVFLFQIWTLALENDKYEAILSDSKEKRLQQQEYLADLEKIKHIIDNTDNSFTAIVTNAMRFVHDNSLHRLDEEYGRYVDVKLVSSLPVIVKKLLLAYHGDESQKPHIACGLRSYAMRAILQRARIFSRLVHVYTDDYEEIKGHRLLEVLNPDTGAWELWDPDLRVKYINRDSRKPVSVLGLLFGERDNIVPKNGPIEGWEETNTKYLKDHFFEAVRFEGIFHDIPGSVIIINRKRFDLHKVFSNGMRFGEYATKEYSNPRLISIPIDPLEN
jgi:hypothetical protein